MNPAPALSIQLDNYSYTTKWQSIGLMYEYVSSSKFTTKLVCAKLFSTSGNVGIIFIFGVLGILSDEIYKFIFRKRGLVVKLASLT